MAKLIFVPALVAVLCMPVMALAKQTRVALSVPTMDCATCPITIKASLLKVAGVTDVKVSYERREAVVIYDDSQANLADLKKATDDAGYPSLLKSGTGGKRR